MSLSLATALVAAAVAAALVALAAAVDLRRRRAPPLPLAPPAPPAAGNPPPRVVVLLPVRDEEADVEACLDTLLAQTATPAVVVVDDGSTDATPRLVARRAHRAGGAPLLVLVAAGPLPAGWRGKLHALEVGRRHALPDPIDDGGDDWVLTTDADTRHHPDLLARALAAAAERGLDCVSVAGFQQTRGAGENLVTPTVFAFLDALLGDWEKAAAAPTGPGARPVANGQFMLIRARALAEIGGFAAVRDAPLDDVALAATLAEAGFRCGFFRAPGLLQVRMYRGLRASLRGWRRILGGFLGRRTRLVPAAATLVLTPPALLLAALALGLWPQALILWLAGALASALLRRGSGHPPLWGLLYPLDALLLAALLSLALRDWRHGWLAPWKGRPIAITR